MNLNQQIAELKLNSQVAFSSNGRYILYLTEDETKFRLSVYSNSYKRIIDEHEFVHHGRMLVNRLGFRGDDKYSVFMWDGTMYLLEQYMKGR